MQLKKHDKRKGNVGKPADKLPGDEAGHLFADMFGGSRFLDNLVAQPITTPFGALKFVEFVGVTKAELDAVQNKQMTVEELYGKLGSDLTDYRRESVI